MPDIKSELNPQEHASSEEVQAEIKEYWSFPVFDKYFENKQIYFFWISMGLFFIFSLCMFDIRIDTGGDDSMYLYEAQRLADGKSFPNWHGAFYSILISIFLKLGGFNLVFFKVLSLLFLAGHQVFTFLTFKNRVSPFLLMVMLFASALMSGITYFASQTYTEALYMLLQSLFFFVFLSFMYSKPNNLKHLKRTWWHYPVLAFIIFMMATTRNIGITAILVVVVVYILEKKYIPAINSILAYLVLKIPFEIYRRSVWNLKNSDISGQISEMILKDPYNSALGREDFSGLIVRTIENAKNYLSVLFLQETGLKSHENNSGSMILTLLIVAMLVAGLIYAYRTKPNPYRAVIVYLGISLGVTFIGLHQLWNQTRLIVIFIPLLLLFVFWTFAQLDKIWNSHIFRFISIVLISIMFYNSFITSIKNSHFQIGILKKNLSGDKYYGYTPDWINFFKVSEWASLNIPEDELIASRRASMSFIYGNGRDFYPIFKIPVVPPDSVMNLAMKSGKAVYFINEYALDTVETQKRRLIKRNMFAIIYADQIEYGVYLADSSREKEFNQLIGGLSQHTINGAAKFRSDILSKPLDFTSALPDELLKKLLENNVHYLITASLRSNPAKKTAETINTVEKYASIINSKYPNIFSRVYQSGKEKDEPARLLKINYEKYQINRASFLP